MKLPEVIKGIHECFGVDYKSLLSVNPKTEKSEIPTRILHLLPSDLSGSNLCANAGNCKRICLHFAGNPAYYKNKYKARFRRSKLFNDAPQFFLNLLVASIAYEFNKNKNQPMAIRLNGTSDILWEELPINLSKNVANFINRRFNIQINGGRYDNVFEVFSALPIKFYDYTKTPRDWAKCRKLGYHLTFSFDGYGNKRNLQNCKEAWANGVNIAAAFMDKLPAEIMYPPIGIEAPVYNGDLSDYRPDDPAQHIIGLKFKRPIGASYSVDDVRRFCIA
jgi:hypothetical protein